jgi:hypothetical protein
LQEWPQLASEEASISVRDAQNQRQIASFLSARLERDDVALWEWALKLQYHCPAIVSDHQLFQNVTWPTSAKNAILFVNEGHCLPRRLFSSHFDSRSDGTQSQMNHFARNECASSVAAIDFDSRWMKSVNLDEWTNLVLTASSKKSVDSPVWAHHISADDDRVPRPLAGYGVQLRVKSTEYDASVNDKSDSLFAVPSSSSLGASPEESTECKDPWMPHAMDKELPSQISDKLGYAIASVARKTLENGKESATSILARLASNLPMIAGTLSQDKLLRDIENAVQRDEDRAKYQGGQNAVMESYRDDFEEKFSVNAFSLDLNAFDVLQVYDSVQRERSLLRKIKAAQCPGSSAAAWLTAPVAVGVSNNQGNPPRFDYRSQHVLWANDLEGKATSGREYSSWDDSVMAFLDANPMFSGGLPPRIKKNLFTTVFAVDPLTSVGRSLIQFVHEGTRIRRHAVRYGLWMYDSESTNSADTRMTADIDVTGQATMSSTANSKDESNQKHVDRQRIRAFLVHVLRLHGIDALHTVLNALASYPTLDSMPSFDQFKVSVQSMKRIGESVTQFTGPVEASTISDLRHSRQELTDRGMLPTDAAPIVANINGLLYFLPEPVSRFTMFYGRLIMYEWQIIGERIANGQISDDRDVASDVLSRGIKLFRGYYDWLFGSPQYEYTAPPMITTNGADSQRSLNVVLVSNVADMDDSRFGETAAAAVSTFADEYNVGATLRLLNHSTMGIRDPSRTSHEFIWFAGRLLDLHTLPSVSVDGLLAFLDYEWKNRLQPLASDVSVSADAPNFAVCAAILSQHSYATYGPSRRTHRIPAEVKQGGNKDPFLFTTRTADENRAWLHIHINVNPLSEHAPKSLLVADYLERLFPQSVSTSIHLRTRIQSLNRKDLMYYRMALDSGVTCLSNIPPTGVYSTFVDPPHAYMVRSLVASTDLDNVTPQKMHAQGVEKLVAEYEVSALVIESHLFGQGDNHGRGFTGVTPHLLKSSLPLSDSFVTVVPDVSITASASSFARARGFYAMSNGGYLQLHLGPIPMRLRADRLTIDRVIPADGDDHSQPPTVTSAYLDAWGNSWMDVSIRTMHPSGFLATASVNPQAPRPQVVSPSQATKNNHKKCRPIRIFSVSSGFLYERLLRIMMTSVVRNTCSPVHFFFLESFLSPSFRQALPRMSSALNFTYEFVNYQWPSQRTFLPRPAEKQRVLWAYKILFTDVLIPPLSSSSFASHGNTETDILDRVLVLDNDQVARADLAELYYMPLPEGHPYAYTPFCDSRTDQEGYRFWKHDGGYWKGHLRGKPYHISALSLVDLTVFRDMRAGDTLRSIFAELSRDPNSLSNLDQDLPNYAQHQVPIYSLPQEWLWCDTWCDQASKKRAKTIDATNDPKTREHKIPMMRRTVEEFDELDQYVAQLLQSDPSAV